MKFPLVGSDQLPYTTVRLESNLSNGNTSVGTAFFVEFKTEKKEGVTCLVTNKHVVNGSKSGKFALHAAKANASGEIIGIGSAQSVSLPDFDQGWIPHPSDNVDLTVMPVQPLFDHAKKSGITIFHRSLSEELIPTDDELEDLFAVNHVVMIGYPEACGIPRIICRLFDEGSLLFTHGWILTG